jgi:hypothetical protein
LVALETQHIIINSAPVLLQEDEEISSLFQRLPDSPRDNDIVGETIAQFLLDNALLPSPKQ